VIPLQHVVALFVGGIANYEVYPELKNPVRDSKAIKRLLEAQNAEVCHISSFKKSSIRLRLQFNLVTQLSCTLYFAGHAVEYENSLRLIVKSNSSAQDLQANSLNLNELHAKIYLKKACLTTAFLDCCPEYTFTASGPEAGMTRSARPIFSEIGQKLILCVCDPNDCAYDSSGILDNHLICRGKPGCFN